MKRSLKQYKYPENLYRLIFGEEKVLPIDYKETTEYVLSLLPEDISKFLVDEMEYKFTDTKLANDLNISYNDVLKLRRKCIYALKDHPVKDILSLGKEEYFKRKEVEDNEVKENIYKTSVYNLGLPRYEEYILYNSGIKTVEDIVNYSDLKQIKYLGPQSMKEIEKSLNIIGVKLPNKYYSKHGNLIYD